MSVIIIFFNSTNIFSENITNFFNKTVNRVLKYKIKIPVSNRTGVINFVFGRSILYENILLKLQCIV